MTDQHDGRVHGDGRLHSWKEIAAYFGKDERTVKRWEKTRGLPVRRVPGGARNSVFANAGELERWLTGGVEVVAPQVALPVPSKPFLSPMTIIGLAVLLMLAGLLIVAGVFNRPQERPAASPEVRELVLRGTYNWNTRTETGLRQAVTDFTDAIALDPQNAMAYAGLANAYNLLSQYSLEAPDQTYPKARLAAERAIQLDPDVAEGYAALGFNEFYWGRHFARSGELFEKALALEPDLPEANHWYALTSMHMGKYDKPLHYIDRALELMPQSRAVRANKALILYHAGRIDDALEILLDLRQSEPQFMATHFYLASLYLSQDRLPEFIDSYERAAMAQGNDAALSIAVAARRGYADNGRKGMLAAMLAEQKRQLAAGKEPPYKLAITEALLGNDAAALDYLGQAVEKGDNDVLGMLIEPAFARYLGQPEFHALLAEVGLPTP